jgi:hypothetical protein
MTWPFCFEDGPDRTAAAMRRFAVDKSAPKNTLFGLTKEERRP